MGLELVFALFVAIAMINGDQADMPAQEIVNASPDIVLDSHTIYQAEDGYLYHGRLYKKQQHAMLAKSNHGYKEHTHE